MILASVKKALEELEKESKKYSQEKFSMATDIGCHAKIFDYLNISGIYGLHGRAIANGIGMALGNPKLNVLAFAGDGAAYSEGISHLIHAFRFNANMTLLVHDNQSFSLTKGQPTPTSQQGYISKAKPTGVKHKPLNPIKLALASNATFIARCNAKDIEHTKEILKQAIKHKGFSYIEIIQDCLIFNLQANEKQKIMYKISPCHNKQRAEKLASEYDYNTKTGKIPLGIIYQTQEPTLDEKVE